jgi:hypothetical protein
VTETEWLACGDPLRLLRAIPALPLRKSELFACACCRSLWPKLTDTRTQRAVEVAEQFVDGAASDAELRDAVALARAVGYGYREVNKARGYRVMDCTAGAVAECCLSIADHRCDAGAQSSFLASHSDDIPAEWLHQSVLVRCVFGNPFNRVTFSTDWRTSTVLALARTMYESREFSAMPILADALQDAGCDDEEVLNHCREGDSHARGCLVVDLVLGKE